MQYKLEKPVHSSIGTEKYQCTVEWRNGTFIADEPIKSGGNDTGPDPFTLLLSSLATCTLVTLRMYIDYKGWTIPTIAVNANLFQTKQSDGTTNTFIDRDITFPDGVSLEQKNRLQEIAQNCPVSKILEGNLKVRTFVYHEEESGKKIRYTNGQVTVVWKPDFCKHSGRCVTQLPQVFDVKAKPWINAEGATTPAIIDQVGKCPTGALSYFYNDQKPA